MPVMAVRPNPMNYGSSRCKRFLSCLQRPAVCGERERVRDREREKKKQKERGRDLGLCSVIQKSIFFSLSLIFIIFLYSFSEEIGITFNYLRTKILFYASHIWKFHMNMCLTSARKSDYPHAHVFFKPNLEIGYFFCGKCFSSSMVVFVWTKIKTHSSVSTCLYLFITFWRFQKCWMTSYWKWPRWHEFIFAYWSLIVILTVTSHRV